MRRKILRVDQVDAVNFFRIELDKECGDKMEDKTEIGYVSRVLAENFDLPFQALVSIPKKEMLGAVLANYHGQELEQAHLYEMAGSHTLVYNGFFRNHVRDCIPVHEYDKLGREFFLRASRLVLGSTRRELLENVSRKFPFWTSACANLEKRLREERYLIAS